MSEGRDIRSKTRRCLRLPLQRCWIWEGSRLETAAARGVSLRGNGASCFPDTAQLAQPDTGWRCRYGRHLGITGTLATPWRALRQDKGCKVFLPERFLS